MQRGDVEAIQARQRDVEQHGVRRVAADPLERIESVTGFTRDFDAGEAFEQDPDACTHQRMIVREQDPAAGRHADPPCAVAASVAGLAKGIRTSMRLPAPGRESSVMVPPAFLTRSVMPSSPRCSPRLTR